VGFITTPIFTRLMSQSEYGDFNYFQTWMMILLYITSLNLEGSLIRASQEYKEDIDNYSFSMIILSTCSTLVWWAICNIFFNSISNFLLINRTYINCMFVYLLLCPAVNMFQNTERYKYKYKWTVAISMTISIGASLLSVVFVLLFQDKLFGRTLGYVLPTFLVGCFIIIYYVMHHCKLKVSYWKYALPITLPYIPHLLSMYLLSNMDSVMILRFCGSECVALYSLAYICGMIITILVTSVNSAFSPWLAEKLNSGDYKAIKRISFPYVAIFSFFSIGAVLVTPEILFVLGGKSYMEAKYVMPPVTAGCLLQFVYCMYVNIEQYEKKTVGMAVASVLAAIINFVLNYIFIPIYGYIAAAYTTYVGYFFLLIMHMYLVKRLGKIHIYDNTKMFILALGTSILIFLANNILDLFLVRYAIIAIYIIILFTIIIKNRDKIKFLKQ